jgi:hypothetical protein
MGTLNRMFPHITDGMVLGYFDLSSPLPKGYQVGWLTAASVTIIG